MTPQTRTSLLELQQLDQQITAVRLTSEGFELLLGEVDAPVLRLEQEVEALEKRLTDIKLEENRLELTIEERRLRAAKLQERMEAVRNVREEAAVHAELEMVRRALESEEQEALSLLDQIKRLEERHEEQEAAHREALAEVEPRRKELVQEQAETESKLKALQADRDAFAAGIDPGERRIYDSIMAGARDVALAELTQDGACGNCYNMVPLQVQNQIRHTDEMIRCEGCGVILTPESAEGLALAQEEGDRIERALKASTDLRDEERAAVSEADALEVAEDAAAQEGSTPAVAPVEAALEEIAADEAPSGALDLGGLIFEDIHAEKPPVEGVAVDDSPADELAAEEVGSDEAPAEVPRLEAARAWEKADAGEDADAGEKADAGKEVDAVATEEPGDEGPGAEEIELQEPTADG
jgi:predicted  nucleic acid-binding Zn-ribbon protein